MKSNILINHEQIADFCRRRHIRKLALFGSVVRDDFGPNSDVDVLVEFKAGQPVTFFDLGDMESELSGLFGGRRTDLLTFKGLNHRLRDRILAEAQVQYEER